MRRCVQVFSVLLVFLIFSCKSRPEKGVVLDKVKMQAVLWDMLQADAFTQNFIKKDSSKNDTLEIAALQKKIFELHKIKREDFTASYDYYSSQPEVMKTILDSVSAKAERDRSKVMMQRYGGVKTEPQ